MEVHRGYVVGWDIARTLTYLGNAALALGQLEEARQCYGEAQQWAADVRSQPAALDALVGLAQVEAKAGRPQQALALARTVLNDDASSLDAREIADRLCAELLMGDEHPIQGFATGKYHDRSRVVKPSSSACATPRFGTDASARGQRSS